MGAPIRRLRGRMIRQPLPARPEIMVTVRRNWDEYVAHRGEQIEEGHPYGCGGTVQEAFDNLLSCTGEDF